MKALNLTFWKILTLVSSLFLSAFIWEAISPLGFDICYKVYDLRSPKQVLVDVNTTIPEFYFKDYKQLSAYLMGAWDSIKTPLPEAGIQVSAELKFPSNMMHRESHAENFQPGLSMFAYDGIGLIGKPSYSRIVSGLNLGSSSQGGPIAVSDRNTSLEWNGYLKIDKPGDYIFSLLADDGAFLFIDNVLLANGSGANFGKAVEKRLFLNQGNHRFCLKYYNSVSGGLLDLKWSFIEIGSENNTRVFSSIPDSNFLHGELDERIELRKIAGPLAFPVTNGDTLIFNSSSEKKGINRINFADISEMLGVAFFKRLKDGTYERTSRFSFIKASSNITLYSSILLSLFCGFGFAIGTYYLLLKYLKTTLVFYPLNFMNTVFIACLARLNSLSTVPYFRYTWDEFLDTWIGLNLILNGKPSSWSWVAHVKTYKWISYLGDNMIYGDYQFHPPPLFGLIVGSWLRVFGVNSIYQFPVFLTRFPSFVSSILVLVGLIYLISKIFTKEHAILAGLFFSLFPANVVLNSIVKADNFLCVISLLVILILVRQGQNSMLRYFTLAVCLALSLLTKEVGLYIPLGTACFAIQSRQYKVVVVSILGAMLGFGLIFLYAYCYSWESFIFSMKAIEGEGPSFISLARVSLEQSLYELSPVVLISWLGLFYISNRTKNIVLIFALSYVAVYGIVALGSYYYPWHQLSLFPFFALGYAGCVASVIFKPSTRFSKMIVGLFLLSFILPFLSVELGHYLPELGMFARRLIMLVVGLGLIVILTLLQRIPRAFLPLYCLLVLLIAYGPFVYILIFKNYI